MKKYDSTMKISEIKHDMRIYLMNEVEQFLKQKYETVGKISANEIGVSIGTYDDDGFINDVCCVIKISAKPFYFKEPQLKDDGKMSKEIKAYDLETAIENFQNGVEE